MASEENATYYEALEKHDLDNVYGVGDWYDEASDPSNSLTHKPTIKA